MDRLDRGRALQVALADREPEPLSDPAVIGIQHLASHVLSLAVQRVRQDWPVRYGFAPVLRETFVEPPWQGTSYLAAHWIRLGETAGRGRQDRKMAYALSRKAIFVLPR